MSDPIDAMLDAAGRQIQSPTCSKGHPLIVTTTATVWLTVEGDRVVRNVVTAHGGDPGMQVGFTLWGCTEGRCEGKISDAARDAAIQICDTQMWPTPELEG